MVLTGIALGVVYGILPKTSTATTTSAITTTATTTTTTINYSPLSKQSSKILSQNNLRFNYFKVCEVQRRKFPVCSNSRLNFHK